MRHPALAVVSMGIAMGFLLSVSHPTQAMERKVTRMPQYQRSTHLLILDPQEIGQVPATKLGGVPWWPEGRPRPTCDRRHPMSFVGQILLSDVPELGPGDGALLSFHYCMQCSDDGHMSFGCDMDEPGRHGYQVDLFERPTGVRPDHAGDVVAANPASARVGTPFPARKVHFKDFDEVPSVLQDEDETWEHAGEALPDYFEIDEDTVLTSVPTDRPRHVNLTKVGGWPTWDQGPTWPVCEEGRRMVFAGQISAETYPDCAWAGGGHAYLFVCPKACRHRKGEFYLHTT